MLYLHPLPAEYPYINYFVIQHPQQQQQQQHQHQQQQQQPSSAADLFRQIKSRSLESFNPGRSGYLCKHDAAASVGLFEETATIARPPVEPLSRKPITDETGYIVSVYKVFKGDDGEKFERNWLYWSGT